jgi:DNA-binding NarL/FixJ family response regulator
MSRALIVHPFPLLREAHRVTLQACGWQVQESANRRDALAKLAGPAARQFGDLVVIDLSHWAVQGTALIRALRRQLACSLPILVLLPGECDAEATAGAALRAGANQALRSDAVPQQLMAAATLLMGRAPVGSHGLSASTGAKALAIANLWAQQQHLLSLPDHAAATVVSARQVLELLLSVRDDTGAIHAAMSLAGLTGGPVPLRRWAQANRPLSQRDVGEFPAPSSFTMTKAMLLVDAGGLTYGFPLDAPVAPTAWWSDNGPVVDATTQGHGTATPLVHLLGPTGFRRLLATDTATVVLCRESDGSGPLAPVRVDALLGLRHVLVEFHSDAVRRASGCIGVGCGQDGQPVLVLDASSLWRHLSTTVQGSTEPHR